MHINWPDLTQKLAQPFSADVIYWRAGAISKDRKRAQALPYADPRVYEDRLNEICPGDWECRFQPWGERRVICELSIHGVTRSSSGEESEGFAPGTAAEAQAFKRACSKFALGRYLYDIPIVWVDYDQERKRLVHVPTLPERFLPSDNTDGADDQRLDQERANAMRSELEKLGLTHKRQLSLASDVLGYHIANFSNLTEAEALEIWHAAKRVAYPQAA